MDIQKEINEILDELLSFLQHEAKQKNTITVSPEFLQRWNAFDTRSYAKHLFQIMNANEDDVKNEVPWMTIENNTVSQEMVYEKTEENPPIFDIQHQLDLINKEVSVCKKCPIHEDRTNTVFGTGNPHAELVFVGEAPGAEEDRQGLPFVGRAGQLLTDIIVKGMKMRREDVYICNVLKCRPPNNRDPNPMEVMNCEPYLIRQLELIRPKVVCALGRIAAQTLLKTDAPLNELRGKWHNYHGIPLRVTYHPAYLLRNPADKKKAWIDIQEIMKLLNGEITVSFDNDKISLL